MESVGAVHIGVARRAEHARRCAPSAAKGVRRRVALVVGFAFDDATADAVDQQRHADQLSRHLLGRRREIDVAGVVISTTHQPCEPGSPLNGPASSGVIQPP